MKGASPLIAMVLVIAFGFAAMAIVLTFVNPLLDKAKDSGIVNEGTQNMQLLDSAIKAVASEAKGSKRTISIKITDGSIRTNSSTDRIALDFKPKSRTVLDGFAGDVKIESRAMFLEYFNQYSDNANANDSWSSVNGSWTTSSGRFLGTGGISYHNAGNQSSFDIAASVIKSAVPDGQVSVTPGDPSNVILFLPFDDNVNNSITIAYDYSKDKNNGTLLNTTSAACFTNNACPSWIKGRFGNATDFNGIGSYINITNSPSLNISTLSIAMWVRPNSTGTLSDIVQMGSSCNGAAVSLQTNGKLSWFQQCNASATVYSASTLSAGTWYHIVGTYNGANMRIYLNGVSDNSSASTHSFSNIGNLTIGKGADGHFNGTIDEVMIFNRALSSAEIGFLYETSLKKITPAGEVQTITPNIAGTINVSLVLASPGTNYFDNIKVKSGAPQIAFIVPYQNVDIVNDTRFGPGNHRIVVRHYGTNATTSRPMVGLEE